MNHLAAQKHLYKICYQLVNACEQRLLDMEKVKNEISLELYCSLKSKHENITSLLQTRIESISITIKMLESSLPDKMKYLLKNSIAQKHDSFISRTKQLLLSIDLLNKMNKKCSKYSSIIEYHKTIEVFTIDIKQLDGQENDLLIYI